MQDNSPQGQSPPPGIMRLDKTKKCSDEQWFQIRALAEAGVPYPEIAADFPIGVHAIRKKASDERWVTPTRLSKGVRGELAADDPAALVAALWKERGEQSRESVYNGASKALARFFALAPVPQSFNEAATALKMVKEAIQPVSLNENQANLSVTILAQSGFAPKPTGPTVDV